MSRLKRILVTGSSGFVGKNLIESLDTQKYEILKVDIVEGINLTDINDIKKIGQFDIAVHLAANTFVPDSFENPYKFYNNNINSTLNILEACRKNNASMIFASSYVYGNPDYLPIDESHPIRAYNPYAQTKIICEEMCIGYWRDHKVPVTIIRPSNIYGEGQNSNFLIPKIIKQTESGFVKLFSSKPKRDFIFINDLVDLYLKVISEKSDKIRIFNAGFGKSYSVKEVVETIKQLSDKKFRVEFSEKERNNEVMDTVLNIRKAKEELNWTPKFDLKKGLEKLI